jgi:hypothetical protein
VCQAIAKAPIENTQVKNVYCTEHTVLHIKSVGWNNETKYVTNKVLLIIELQFIQFKGTSYHSELSLLNQQQRKERWERKPGMLVMERKHDMKHQKSPKPAVNMLWFILCCTLFLVGGK